MQTYVATVKILVAAPTLTAPAMPSQPHSTTR